MYDVSFDHDAQLLAIRWHRIFTPDEVVAYTRDVMRQFLAARFRPGYRLMIDMSACGPQPQETLAALAQRSMQLQATVQENTLSLGDGQRSVDVELVRLL